MVDARRYIWSKEKGLTNIVEKEGRVYVSFKLFDVHDGSEIEPELQEINEEELLERKRVLQEHMDGIDMIIVDKNNFKQGR